jgi:uncharacterized protein involved in exopolysaccharide biosynthesis
MQDLPRLPRALPRPALTPLIPLDYLQPGLSLLQTVSIWRAYRRMMTLVVVTVLALTALAVMAWPRSYVARVTLMVNYEVNDPLNGKELPVGQVASYIATQVELMQTPGVLLEVVDRLNLTQDADYTKDYVETGSSLREWVADQVARRLAVYQSQRGGQLIYITYTARKPALAAAVANTVAQVYKEQDGQRTLSLPGLRARRYTQQLKDLKGKVFEAQRALTSYEQGHALLDEGATSHVDLDLLTSLEARLADARASRRLAEAKLTVNPEVSDPVLISPHIQTLKTQLAAQELRGEQLERQYMPEHPDVIDARLQLVSTRRSLASSMRSYADNAQASLVVAQRQEAGLQAAVDQQRRRALTRGQVNDDAGKHRLELESAQVVYRRALEGYDQIMFASSGPQANISLVSPATPPVRPNKPIVLTGLLLGALLALGLGLGLPLMVERFNRHIRCRDDIEHEHHIPVLAEFHRLSTRT